MCCPTILATQEAGGVKFDSCTNVIVTQMTHNRGLLYFHIKLSRVSFVFLLEKIDIFHYSSLGNLCRHYGLK